MLAKKTSKNQLTLPKEVAGKFPDVEYFDVRESDGVIVLVPVRMVPAASSIEAIRAKMKKLGVKPRDVKKAVEWARKQA
ncbi:MAG: AbrB/MazE/SpoVT family DNA-binding domain-containing protein [Deltaproteobacteria bacterium]|nr:AbrB/MazE/SpoVT family DNA-binding domain-containing protein [Deltaproteobacteria bacterium]